MADINLFEVAVREKYRFNYRGQISTEDLWDLSLENLDYIFKELNRELRKSEQESLLEQTTPGNETIKNKIAIIRYIVAYKLAEKEKASKAAENKLKKQKIIDIISQKQDESLHNKSVEELMAMLNDLEQ